MKEHYIYEILNLENGKKYIGRTCNFLNRFDFHKKTLNNGTHHNKDLQKDWFIYGDKNFCFNVIIKCMKDDVYKQEQHFLNNNVEGYNSSKYSNEPVKRNYKNIETSPHMKRIKQMWNSQYKKYVLNKNNKWLKYEEK